MRSESFAAVKSLKLFNHFTKNGVIKGKARKLKFNNPPDEKRSVHEETCFDILFYTHHDGLFAGSIPPDSDG